MTSEQLRRHLDAVPFEPFRVSLPNGRHADVPHPDFLHVFPGGRFASVVHPDDTMEVMDIFVITSIRTLPSNGKRSRRIKNRRKD